MDHWKQCSLLLLLLLFQAISSGAFKHFHYFCYKSPHTDQIATWLCNKLPDLAFEKRRITNNMILAQKFKRIHIWVSELQSLITSLSKPNLSLRHIFLFHVSTCFGLPGSEILTALFQESNKNGVLIVVQRMLVGAEIYSCLLK